MDACITTTAKGKKKDKKRKTHFYLIFTWKTNPG